MDKSKTYVLIGVVATLVFVYLALNTSIDYSGSAVGCSSNEDCKSMGCSNSMCVLQDEEEMFTTCEWKEEYECLEFTSCGCFEGECRFEQNEEYINCLEKYES